MGSGDVAAIFISGFFILSIASVIILRGPLGKAWARRIEGASGQVDSSIADDIQGRVAELEERVGRLHELEERLDFAERLLAQQREQPRIGS